MRFEVTRADTEMAGGGVVWGSRQNSGRENTSNVGVHAQRLLKNGPRLVGPCGHTVACWERVARQAKRHQ